MKTSFHLYFPLLSGLAFSLALAFPGAEVKAADITGTYQFEGKASARGGAGSSTKKFKGKMRVSRNAVRLQIPINKNGNVVACRRMIRAKLNRRLKPGLAEARRLARFNNASCGSTRWTGSLRLRWAEHPEGYALSFSMGGVNVDDAALRVTGRFTGSTGTLSTEANAPIPEVPEIPEAP